MAKLKSLKLKEKVFIFKTFGNAEDENPAKIVFSRFPILGESFVPVDKKNLFEGLDVTDISKREIQAKIADNVVKSFLDNVASGKTDYQYFFDECVESLKDFEYGDVKIETPKDFWKILPQDAAIAIAKEAFEYATTQDQFTMGNLIA